jgi:Heparinase II/III-like protein
MGKGFRFGCFALVCAMPISSWAVDHIFADGFEHFWKVSLPDVQTAATDNSVWTPLKARCDADLNSVIGDIYAGFDWRQAAQDYGLCYAAGTLRGDPNAPTYSKKAVAILKTLARTYPVIASNQNHQFLAFGDGTRKIFTLPMTPLTGTTVHVYSNNTAVSSFTYSGTTQVGVTPAFDSGTLYPVLRISNTLAGATSNNALEYTPEVDFHVSMRDLVSGSSVFNVLHWLGSTHPAGMYFVATNATATDTEITAGNFTVSGTTLTFTTAPAAGKSLFVQYLGSDYTQTSNLAGRVESVKPDGPGYNMRAMNVGLAYGYDTVRQSPDMTAALRQEFYTVLNGQLDWYTAAGYEGPNLGENPIGNYYIRGYLTGAMFTAYATDSDNPRALPGGDLKPLAHTLLMQTFNSMQTDLPGGYGPQGTYSEGTNQDMLQLYDLWKRLTTIDGATEDLAPQLEWTANLVPATIHGTKPDRATFYDGGDWNDLPATPLVGSMTAFVKYQPNHPMTPFARQLLADVGSPVPGAMTDYKTGAGAFALSYLAKTTGPLYARSDWGTSAVWVSLADGPVIEDHQHLDQGHFTLQRGADYLLINSGGYGILNTLPSHNTLGFDDVGAGNHIVYPPGQGYWGPDAKITRYEDANTFVYAEADIADAYVNNDGVTNSVVSALRTFVYLRPNVVFVHDEMQVANPAVKKIFNVNFNAASVPRSGDVFSAVHGGSKLFMRALVPANPAPVIALINYNGGSNNVSNYQTTIVGQTTGTFLHLFQLAPSAQSAMATSSYILSADSREQGAEVDMGARRWIVMASRSASPVLNTSALNYSIPLACPCTHVVTGLMPSTAYQITLVGGSAGTISASSDAKALLTFDTNDPATTGVQIH